MEDLGAQPACFHPDFGGYQSCDHVVRSGVRSQSCRWHRSAPATHWFRYPEDGSGHAEGWDIFLELFSEAMVAAATASAKMTATWLKKQLADRKKRLSAQTAAKEEKEKGLKEAD